MSKQEEIAREGQAVLLELSPAEAALAKRLLVRLSEVPPDAPCDCSQPELHELARRIYACRRERRHFFPDSIFFDPVWDMLLILYCSEGGRERLSVSSVCLASEVPATTALRWLNALYERGYVRRVKDERDARRTFVELTSTARGKMDDYLARVAGRHFPVRSG